MLTKVPNNAQNVLKMCRKVLLYYCYYDYKYTAKNSDPFGQSFFEKTKEYYARIMVAAFDNENYE